MNDELFGPDLKLTPYWWDEVPRPALPDRELPRKVDVVIIGGGAVGSSIAYFLASNADFRGKVTVIERDPTYRYASSALSLSSIRVQFSTPTNMHLSAFGMEFLKEAPQRLAVDGESANVGYIQRPYIPEDLAAQQPMLYQFLLNKWYFDELYELIFVRPAKWIGYQLWKKGDGAIIDGLGPDGVSARVLDVTRNVVKIQTGYLYHYAFAMLIGVAGLITWFMFTGGQ